MTMEFINPWENEIGFRGYLSDHVNITGRDWLIEHVSSEITATEKGLLLSAKMGYGKTALISKLLCADPSSNAYKLRQSILAFHMCKYDVSTTQQPDTFIRNIAGKIASEVPEFELKIANAKRYLKQRCGEDPIGCLEDGLIYPLKQISKQEKHIIVIDALDECDSEIGRGRHSVLSLLIKRIQNFPNWIKFILTSRNISSITTRFTNLKHLQLDETNAKHLQDVEVYINGRLTSNFNSEKNTTIHHVSETLIQRSRGNFLFLKHMLDIIIKTKQIHYAILPTSLEEIYLQNFERVFLKNIDLFRDSKVVFEIMCASYKPLTESELVEIAKHSKNPIDHNIFKYLGNNLGHFFIYHDDRLYFTHKALRDWLLDDKRKYSSFSIVLRNGYGLISKYYISQLKKESYVEETLDFIFKLPLYVSKSEDENIEQEFLQVIKSERLSLSLVNMGDTLMHYISRTVNDYTAIKLFDKLSVKNFNIDSRNEANVTSAFIAAAYGHTETLRALHELGADISFKVKPPNTCVSCTSMNDIKHLHYWGYNLLHISAQNGHFESSKYLLKQNKTLLNDETSFGSTPFQLAAEFGHEDILNLFLANGYSSIDQLSLHHAASNGHLKVVDLLLKNGAVDYCLLCNESFYWLDKDVFRLQSISVSDIDRNLRTNFQDDWHRIICESALEAAIRYGHYNTVERLLEEQINAFYCTEYGGRTPLMSSVKYGHFEIFKRLFEKDENISATCINQQIFHSCRQQQLSDIEYFSDYLPHLCPLRASIAHLLAMYNRKEMAKYLHGKVEVRWHNRDDTGADALHYAACHNSLSMILFLVERLKMNVCSRTNNGSTPYHSAVLCNSYQALSLLRNIRPSRVECLKDNEGLTILDYAFLKTQHDFPFVYCPENLLLIDEIMTLCRCHNLYISKLDYERIVRRATESGNHHQLIRLYCKWNFQDIDLVNDDEIRKLFFDAAFQSLPDLSTTNTPRLHQTLTLNSSDMEPEPLISPYDRTAIWLLQIAGFKLNSTDIKDYISLVVQKERYHVLMQFKDFVSHNNFITALDDMISAGDGTIIQHDHLHHCFLNCDGRSKRYPLHRIVMNRNNKYWRYSPQFNDFLNKTLQNLSARYLDNCLDAEGYNILHRAILGGHIAAVKFLIHKGMSVFMKPKFDRDILSELVIYAPSSKNMQAFGREPLACDILFDMYYTGNTRVETTWRKSEPEFTINFDSTASFIIDKYTEKGRSYTVCKNYHSGLSVIHIAAAKRTTDVRTNRNQYLWSEYFTL